MPKSTFRGHRSSNSTLFIKPMKVSSSGNLRTLGSHYIKPVVNGKLKAIFQLLLFNINFTVSEYLTIYSHGSRNTKRHIVTMYSIHFYFVAYHGITGEWSVNLVNFQLEFDILLT